MGRYHLFIRLQVDANRMQQNLSLTRGYWLSEPVMLALARNIAPAYQSLVEGRWDRKHYMGSQLAGKTLGIVGLGRGAPGHCADQLRRQHRPRAHTHAGLRR